MPLVFVSHSSKDERDRQLLSDFVSMLKNVIGLKDEDIFCSSVVPTGLRSGENTDSTILNYAKESPVFIALLTKNYVDSRYSLVEYGIRLGLGKGMKLVCCENNIEDVLLWPYNSSHITYAMNVDSLGLLLKDIASVFGKSLNTGHTSSYVDFSQKLSVGNTESKELGLSDTFFEGVFKKHNVN